MKNIRCFEITVQPRISLTIWDEQDRTDDELMHYAIEQLKEMSPYPLGLKAKDGLERATAEIRIKYKSDRE